ncbi:hypothetical protein HK102_011422, partial [Quaeritorhiza haematococci]
MRIHKALSSHAASTTSRHRYIALLQPKIPYLSLDDLSATSPPSAAAENAASIHDTYRSLIASVPSAVPFAFQSQPDAFVKTTSFFTDFKSKLAISNPLASISENSPIGDYSYQNVAQGFIFDSTLDEAQYLQMMHPELIQFVEADQIARISDDSSTSFASSSSDGNAKQQQQRRRGYWLSPRNPQALNGWDVMMWENGANVTNLTQQSPPSWGLDRIDQRNSSLDGAFTYPSVAGQNITVYVLDTGIATELDEFDGRAFWGTSFVECGGRFPPDMPSRPNSPSAETLFKRQYIPPPQPQPNPTFGPCFVDDNGHGTFVASLIG